MLIAEMEFSMNNEESQYIKVWNSNKLQVYQRNLQMICACTQGRVSDPLRKDSTGLYKLLWEA